MKGVTRSLFGIVALIIIMLLVITLLAIARSHADVGKDFLRILIGE